MDSKEFGLVAAQQLFQLHDLHYGYFEANEIPAIEKFFPAQEKHTEVLFSHIEAALQQDRSQRILDSGCGVGVTTQKLLDKGYSVDGLVPSNWMARHARERNQSFIENGRCTIFECRLEEYPASQLSDPYGLVFFSESFQYVNMDQAFELFKTILKKNGKVVIFDFFKKDNVPGKSPLGGGHSLHKFYQTVESYHYAINTDIDVTDNLAPNIDLFKDVVHQRVMPFLGTLDKFLTSKNKTVYNFIKWIFRKKLDKLSFKYSDERNGENFKKFKSYRLIVLEKN